MYKYLLFLIIFTSCSITEPYYLNLSKEKRDNYFLPSLDTNVITDNNIFSINSVQLNSVISNDTSNYKLLIFFTYWCPSSNEFLPRFVSNLPIKNLKTFFISPDDWVYKPQYILYSKNLNLKNKIYLLDVYSYGEKRSPHYRMGKFISEICQQCQEIKGFPSFILFNHNNKIVFMKVGSITIDTISELITKSP